MADPKQYRIKVHAANGETYYWHKQGQIHVLPEDLVHTWVAKFKPDLFEIRSNGEMVGAGRGATDSFVITKVEKEEI